MRKMRILISLLIICTGAALLATAQNAQQTTMPNQQMYWSGTFYDDFSQRFLNPAKWKATVPGCWGNVLECVREIQNGKLRLAVQHYGATDTDSGGQWSQVQLSFHDPNAVTKMKVDLSVTYSGIGCNPGDTNGTVTLDGLWFNSGNSSSLYDDVAANLIVWVIASDPTTMRVSLGVGWAYDDYGHTKAPGVNVEFATYPVGTPLTLSLIWDQANQQFIGKVKPTGDWHAPAQAAIPYSALDSSVAVLAPAVRPNKQLAATLSTPNCTTIATKGRIEARFDNVIINPWVF